MTRTSGNPDHNHAPRPAPQRLIQEPRWSRPALLHAGDLLEVVVPRPGAAITRGSLLTPATGQEHISLQLASTTETPDNAHLKLNLRLHPDLTPGLYDLELATCGAMCLYEPNCVWVVPAPEPRDFTFVHISDLHIVNPSKVNPHDRAADISRLMTHLRDEIQPRFIVDTGDLVSRYGLGGTPLPPQNVIQQIRRVREILLDFRMPHFITPGNHDVAFPFIRKEWKQCMGGYWGRDTDDYAFTYGGARFIALDRSVAYNESHEMIDKRLRPGQVQWLQARIADCAGQPVFLFCHYDYSGELNQVLEAHPNITLLYGHTNVPSTPEKLRGQDAGLRSPFAYQLFRVSASTVQRASGENWNRFAPHATRNPRHS